MEPSKKHIGEHENDRSISLKPEKAKKGGTWFIKRPGYDVNA